MNTCAHLGHIRHVTPSAQGCEDCLKSGDSWVHLRECLECSRGVKTGSIALSMR